MYKNISGKIKVLAQIIFVLGAIVSIIWGILVCLTNDVMIGLLFLIVGTLISWISTFSLYGFGELIEKVCSIEEKMNSSAFNKKVQKETKAFEICTDDYKKNTVVEDKNEYVVVGHKWTCLNCGEIISEDICPYCGYMC